MQSIVDYSQLVAAYSKNNKLKFDKRPGKWLPLYPSPKLAGLIADLMADGNLQEPPRWRFDYCSNSLSELARFETVLYSLFGVKGKIRDCTTNKYGTKNYGVNCRPLAKILFLAGVPCGNKVLKQYSIPEWILNDKGCFAIFARRYFDCEGGVYIKDRMLTIEIYKSTEIIESGLAFLNQVKEGLQKYFGITTMNPFLLSKKVKRTYGATVQGVRLRIRRKEDLAKFYALIGLDTASKMERLKLAIV
ncbi:MAG: LAGLIDADG family homing endonuclease [archaeon]